MRAVLVSMVPSVVLVFAAACGGASAGSPGAASPGAGASSGDGGAPAAVASAPASAPSATTTTTMTLGDAGDLQGTKLQGSSTSSSTADMPNGGPARGPHPSEPGRGVKDIQVIVQAHRDQARACYDDAQRANPDPSMKGNLDIQWTIDPTGKVTDASLDDSRSDIHDKGIGQCVMGVIKGLHFAVSAKGFETRAHYPFNFNPRMAPSRPSGSGSP